jgi:hypothetical protein
MEQNLFWESDSRWAPQEPEGSSLSWAKLIQSVPSFSILKMRFFIITPAPESLN